MQMYFSFYLWLIYFAGCGISQCTRYALVFEILRTFAIVMLCISPVVVIIESFFSHELSYLSNILQDQTAWSYIQEMHEVPPQIVMIVECYHYETRVRVVYYTDSNGNTQSRTETYTEKVTTFIDQDEFSFGSWVDVSKREMPPIGHSSLTRLKIDPCILFGDQETADDYASQVAAMIERNRHRDVHTDYSAKRQIPGLKKRISTYVDLNVRPWWIRTGYFWLATLLMMTWPYRWLFRAKTGKTYYILKKKMYKSATPPREVDITDPIAVLSNNAPSLVGPCAANNQSSDPMTEVGAMNTSFQNYHPPYPAVDTSAGQPSSAGPHPSAPHLVHGLGAPHPQVHDLSSFHLLQHLLLTCPTLVDLHCHHSVLDLPSPHLTKPDQCQKHLLHHMKKVLAKLHDQLQSRSDFSYYADVLRALSRVPTRLRAVVLSSSYPTRGWKMKTLCKFWVKPRRESVQATSSSGVGRAHGNTRALVV